jgi:hypothetical protein
MWIWIGLGLGSFIGLSLLIALVFARVLATLNGDMIELLEGRVASESPLSRGQGSPTGVSDRQPSDHQELLSRASATP